MNEIVHTHLDNPDLTIEAVADQHGVSEAIASKVISKYHRKRMKEGRMSHREKVFAQLALKDVYHLMRLPESEKAHIIVESNATRDLKSAA